MNFTGLHVAALSHSSLPEGCSSRVLADEFSKQEFKETNMGINIYLLLKKTENMRSYRVFTVIPAILLDSETSVCSAVRALFLKRELSSRNVS